jgi:hypothetical protein
MNSKVSKQKSETSYLTPTRFVDVQKDEVDGEFDKDDME